MTSRSCYQTYDQFDSNLNDLEPLASDYVRNTLNTSTASMDRTVNGSAEERHLSMIVS
jgi:hypothetical protein